MFSKFLRGQDPTTLAALKMQWDMEFAKANRKFKKSKTSKKKKGRPPLGQLNLNTLRNDGKFIDLTNIARSVATTREGRRLHQKVTEKIQKPKETKEVVFFATNFMLFDLILFMYFLIF